MLESQAVPQHAAVLARRADVDRAQLAARGDIEQDNLGSSPHEEDAAIAGPDRAAVIHPDP
jgi:hypothetical protein